MRTSVIGFPRIGKDRELKFASEKYFAGKISEAELLESGRMQREYNLKTQKAFGIDLISSNDFSFYDNVLDTAFLFNAIPQRYKDLKLPVMQKWDYSRLKIAPCRFSGSYFTDDLVICGHNYRRHFSPVKGIDIGENVYFVTVDNMVYHYKVSNRENLRPTSIEQMIRNQNNVDEDLEIAGTSKDNGYLDSDESNDPESYGQWDLCLFTCTTGGQARCAVRCQRVGEAKEKKTKKDKKDKKEKKDKTDSKDKSDSKDKKDSKDKTDSKNATDSQNSTDQ